MRLRLLFIIFIVLLGGALIYEKAPPRNFESGEGARVKEETAQNNQGANKENLAHQELPSLPKTPEVGPVEPKQEISAPPGLEISFPPASTELPGPSPEPVSSSVLTRAGIILQTNLQRQQNNVGFLRENGVLDEMAAYKANDMCIKQYFAHISPGGVGAGDLADGFGYDYISVGENLALGPFEGDEAVVLAWMNSPGHRANILNSKFSEIGIGVAKCVFDGRSTWLAVQHFGKPASDCPKVDTSLGKTIEGEKATLAEMKERLLVMRAEIEASDPGLDPDYNSKVGSYNSLVREYNTLIGETKTLINRYNSQIATFNVCASG